MIFGFASNYAFMLRTTYLQLHYSFTTFLSDRNRSSNRALFRDTFLFLTVLNTFPYQYHFNARECSRNFFQRISRRYFLPSFHIFRVMTKA